MDILDHGGMRGGRGIPGLDIWDNLDPHITLVRVLSPVSHPETQFRRLGELVLVVGLAGFFIVKTKYKELDVAWTVLCWWVT